MAKGKSPCLLTILRILGDSGRFLMRMPSIGVCSVRVARVACCVPCDRWVSHGYVVWGIRCVRPPEMWRGGPLQGCIGPLSKKHERGKVPGTQTMFKQNPGKKCALGGWPSGGNSPLYFFSIRLQHGLAARYLPEKWWKGGGPFLGDI